MDYGRALDNMNDGAGECCGEMAGWYGDEPEDSKEEESQPVRYDDNGK